MENWNKLRTPPPTALKQIKAGRLKGMSDINPEWRYQIMTEVYGECGFGWKYNIVKKWTEQGSDNQVFAFVDIDLFVKVGDTWSDAIPGTGGSMLVTKERSGLHSSDEAFKMATTDALSTAMKMIGVAADIYLGRWDGSQYRAEEKKPSPAITITQDQVNWLVEFYKGHKISTKELVEEFKKHYKFDPYKTTPEEFDKIKTTILEDYGEE